MPTLETLLNRARFLHLTFIITVVLIPLLGEWFGPVDRADIAGVQVWLLAGALAALSVLMFSRQRLLLPAAERLRRSVADPAAQQGWLFACMLTFALAESVVVVGFALRLLGGSLLDSLPLYAAGFLALLMLTPRLAR